MNTKTVLFAVCAVLVLASMSKVNADVVSGDHPTFGTDSLTINTTDGMAFLDLSFTAGMSHDEVSSELGAGGNFEGFRYASESEVVDLVIEHGFDHSVSGGNLLGTPGADQLSGLVDLLGQTGLSSDGFTRSSAGITSTSLNAVQQRVVFIFDQIASDSGDEVGLSTAMRRQDSLDRVGSFLVVVPEPNGILIVCASLLGTAARRRRPR